MDSSKVINSDLRDDLVRVALFAIIVSAPKRVNRGYTFEELAKATNRVFAILRQDT